MAKVAGAPARTHQPSQTQPEAVGGNGQKYIHIGPTLSSPGTPASSESYVTDGETESH